MLMINFLSLLIALLVYCMEANGVPRSEFFQYGSSAGDQTLGRFDGTTKLFQTSVPILFYSKSYTRLQVNGNGYLSLGNSNDHAYARNRIAPYYADHDHAKGGNTYARVSTTDTTAINKVNSLVANYFADFPNFVATEVVIATWDAVAGYCCNSNANKRNTFQVVVASDGTNSFAIFLYLDGGINWPDATSTSSKAVAGFRTSGQQMQIEGSSTDAMLNIEEKSNVGIPGLFIFKINGAIVPGEASLPSPTPYPPDDEETSSLPSIPISTSVPEPDEETSSLPFTPWPTSTPVPEPDDGEASPLPSTPTPVPEPDHDEDCYNEVIIRLPACCRNQRRRRAIRDHEPTILYANALAEACDGS